MNKFILLVWYCEPRSDEVKIVDKKALYAFFQSLKAGVRVVEIVVGRERHTLWTARANHFYPETLRRHGISSLPNDLLLAT